MADVIEFKVYGDDMQMIEIELDPSEGVRAEAGAMTYMESGITMQTSTSGGLFKGLKKFAFLTPGRPRTCSSSLPAERRAERSCRFRR